MESKFMEHVQIHTWMKIQTLSNRLLKFLLKLDYMTPTLELHKNLNILTINDMVKVNILSFVRNCLKGECPSLFNDYFTYSNHHYRTRTQMLYIPLHRTSMAASSVKIKGAKLWNTLPLLIKEKSNLKSFRNVIKNYYISLYWMKNKGYVGRYQDMYYKL